MIRVPAGVVIDGKAWGGRFVTTDQLISLAAAVEDSRGLAALERLAEREYRKAASVHQRAADKYVEAPERYRERRAQAQQQQQEWERVRDAAKDFQETTPKAPIQKSPQRSTARGVRGGGVHPQKSVRGKKSAAGKRSAGRGAATGTKGAQRVRPSVKKPRAVEWELGFKYRTTRRNRRSSDVDVNLRIRRVDSRPFNVDQARKVMDHVRRTQETPDGFMVAGVDWKRPYAASGWRRGNINDMESFWAPMYSRDRDTRAWDIRPGDFRFGAVQYGKDDDDDDA
jgi:hypothetical protein